MVNRGKRNFLNFFNEIREGFLKSLYLTLLVILCARLNIYAQWPAIPSPNVAVTNQAATTDAKDFWATPDGIGGSYSVWHDDRNDPGNFGGIFCQRMRSNGFVKFVANGIQISDVASSDQKRPSAAEGTNSTALIVWEDERNSGTTLDDIYAKSIDSVGATLWGGANGVLICNAAEDQQRPQIVSDGAGGAIIVWEDDRNTVDTDIYAQRINSSGVTQWAANGVAISAATDNQQSFHLIADGSGGAIIAWEDDRTGVDTDIQIQKINSSGVVQWTVDGFPVSTATDDQTGPQIVTDGAGGAIITWVDLRTGGVEDIYAQRITSAGAIGSGSWVANGVVVCDATDAQTRPTIVSDLASGAIIAWEDDRSGVDTDIYVHRISSLGVTYTTGSWVADGIVVSNATNNQSRVHASSTDVGAALIAWEDLRSGAEDIYVEAIMPDGSFLTGVADGLQITSDAEIQARPFIFQNNGTEWIVLWEDDRNDPGNNNDVYAQGLNSTVVPALGPLPIELLWFKAKENANEIDLSWITASETNNDFFTVEKLLDLETKIVVTTIKGKGDSQQPVSYFAIDPYPSIGLNYYVLKQTDFDGTYTYSRVISVNFTASIPYISVFPNPITAGDEINVKLTGVEGAITLLVFDTAGRLLLEKFYSSFNVPLILSVHDQKLFPGIYLIKVVGENFSVSERFVVSH